MSATKKAVVAQVKLGAIEFEGLMLPDGSFGISVSQLSVFSVFSGNPQNINRSVKALLGKENTLLKVPSELNTTPVNFITLVQFETLLTKLDRAGNEQAQHLRDELVGLSLTQLFCDSFGQKFDAEERQAYLNIRQKARKQHRPCVTDYWAKVDGVECGREYASRTITLKVAAGIKSNIKVKDMTEPQLRVWALAQEHYGIARKIGADHRKAIEIVKDSQQMFLAQV